MKKILLILFLFTVGFSTAAYAETGKNMNWCKTDGKTRSPLYLANVNGKIKKVKHKSTDALENPENKIVIIWNYGGGNAQEFNGYCSAAIKNFAGLAGHKIGDKETIFWFNFELRKAGGEGKPRLLLQIKKYTTS